MIERTPDVLELKPRSESRFLVKTRLVRWGLAGSMIFLSVLALALFLVPQSYTAKLSVSLASTTGGGSGLLASVTGIGNSPATKYVGVLRSRSFAEQVAERSNLQQVCCLASSDDAVDTLLDGLVVADNPRDGLLYVTVSLNGPAYFAPNSSTRKAAVKDASARAANLYSELLHKYIATSDMDSDAILLNGASDQLAKARRDYDNAVNSVGEYMREHSGQAGSLPRPAKPGGAQEADSMAGVLQALYTEQATLESEISATEAAQRVGEQLQANQLHNLAVLPSEDPLLTQARAGVTLLRNTLDNERVLLGPEHPTVVADKERLRLAELNLNEQSSAVRQGLTTKNVDSRVKMQSLKSRYATLSQQVAAVEHKSQTGREMATEFEQRRNEVMLRLEVLKTMSAQAATLSMQVVSAQNRLKVVDTARPPRTGSPGPGKLAFLCALVTAAIIAVWVYAEHRSFQRSHSHDLNSLTVATS